MTLIASTRTLDGIIIAGDSLATFSNAPIVKGDVDVSCPACNHQHTVAAVLTGTSQAATTLSYAQKIFPFMDNFGVGIYGGLQVLGRTVHFAFREFEKICRDKDLKFDTPQEAAQAAGDYLHDLLVEYYRHFGLDLKAKPDDFFYSGFQLIGYDGDKPYTCNVTLGNAVRMDSIGGLDVSVCGIQEVTGALFEVYAKVPDSIPFIDAFSLQDAIEYVEFLIKTTALHQRFSRKIPSVGGEIDIASVTPFDGFQWVRQKKLYR